MDDPNEETTTFTGTPRARPRGVPRIIVLKGEALGRSAELTGIELTIGRKDDNGLRLDSTTVSRHHCRLVNMAGDWFIEDLGSTSGTRLNGGDVPARTRRLVAHGDQISIGDHEIVFLHEQDMTKSGALSGLVLDRAKVDAEVAALFRDLPSLWK